MVDDVKGTFPLLDPTVFFNNLNGSLEEAASSLRTTFQTAAAVLTRPELLVRAAAVMCFGRHSLMHHSCVLYM